MNYGEISTDSQLTITNKRKILSMKSKILCSLFALLCSSSISLAQQSNLLYKDYIQQVISNHPSIQAAKSSIKIASAAVLESQGAFDPFFNYESEQKQLNNQLYYNYQQTQLQIPVWNGIDIRTGIENSQGLNVNPENTIGKSSYLGVKIPIGADLLIDKRKLGIQQSKQQLAISQSAQQQSVNELIADAQIAYMNWSRAYFQYQLFVKLSLQNKDRLAFVITEYHQGLRPAIDTTEALSQLQQFQLNETDARFQFESMSKLLENYLWNANATSNNFVSSRIPDSSFFDVKLLATLDIKDSSISEEHPKLAQYVNKLSLLAIEKNYKTQQLLPKAYFKANTLSKGYYDQIGFNSIPYQENYKYGLSVAVPLLQRSARGALLQTKYKIQETEFNKAVLQTELGSKLKYYTTQIQSIQQQLVNTKSLIKNLTRLYDSEQLRFQQGESSVFLINSREIKITEAIQKQLDLYYKWQFNWIQLALTKGIKTNF
jgi:outer membrane protein TolC